MPTSVIDVNDLVLDNSIKTSTTDTSNYFADNGIIRADFIQTGNTVKYTSNGRTVKWVPQNMRYIDSLGMEDTIYSTQDVPLETKANYARFNRTMPDIDDWFIIENDQVKHQILVQGFQRDPMPYLSDPIQFAVGGQLVFDADLTVRSMGMTLTGAFQTADAIQICDGDKVIFTLPQVVAYDSKIPERAQTTGFYNVTTNEAGNLQFDIVIDNAWVSDVARVYPLVIDPTIIVSSAYDTSGNGGRKMVRLSNNWSVTCAYASTGTTVYFYVTKDNGQTWAQLCTWNPFSASVDGFAIASSATTVYVYGVHANNSTSIFTKFDATTVSGGLTNVSSPDQAQSIFGSGVSLDIDGNGKLWTVCCSKNPTYPNSFNPRVSSSTDGGATWTTPTQVTASNTSGYDYTNPCLVLDSQNTPFIFVQMAHYCVIVVLTTKYTTKSWDTTGNSSWGNKSVYSGSNTYIQSNPCDALDSNDVIYSGWHGSDATTTNYRARWSKSTDGGVTWSAMGLINPNSTNASTNVSFAVRPDNSVDAFWQEIDPVVSATYTQIRRANLPAGSSTWSAPVTITNNTTSNATNPQTLWSKFNENSSDALRYMWMTGSAIDYDSITFNAPPNAPTLTAHANFDASTAQTFTATFSDPDSGNTMSARQLQVVDIVAGTTVYDTGKVGQTTTVGNQNFDVVVPANTLTNGKQYQWREQTWDNSGAQGPYSTYSTFYTAAAPTVIITAPTANQVITTTQMTAQWSESDPGNNPQGTYEVQLKDSTGAITMWDSGQVSDVNARALTIGYTLANNTSYQVVVTVTNSKGVASTATVQPFSVSFTPPTTATITVTPNPAGAYNTVTVTNPAPSGSQPTVSNNDLYRKQAGSTASAIRIATGIANNGAHNDYTAPSGVSHDYYVLANGSNGTSSQSATASQTVTLSGVWLHDVTDPSTILQLTLGTLGTNKTTDWTPESTVTKPAGRASPVVVFGETENYTYNLPVDMLKSAGTWSALDALARRKSVLCVRDYRGRKVFGVILDLPQQDEIYGQSVSLPITQVDYKEGV